MGLPQDEIINKFKITKYMMEDYIIKILMTSGTKLYEDLKI